jgi:hypothetical protein
MTPLQSLDHDDFRNKVAFASTPSVLRLALLATSEVSELRTSIETGAVTESQLRNFVAEKLVAFRVGERFSEDFTLAAIAVAIETHHSQFAAEYLDELSQLNVCELAIVIEVVRECLKQGRPRISLETRTVFLCHADDFLLAPRAFQLEPSQTRNRNITVTHQTLSAAA